MIKRFKLGYVYLILLMAIHTGCNSSDRVVMRLSSAPPDDLVMLLDYPKRKIYHGDNRHISSRIAEESVWKILFDWDGFHQKSGFWGPLEEYSGLRAIGYKYKKMYVFQLYSTRGTSPMVLIVPENGEGILVVNPYDPVLGIPWGPDEE